jgi:hypothetical protein
MSAGELFLTDKLKECTWTLNERQSEAETRENGGQVVALGRPFWSLTARYENLTDTDFRTLTAWLARRKRSRVSFTAWRPDRPALALNSSITNSGLGVSAVSISGGTVSLTGLGSNVISPGDMIGFSTLASGYWVGMATATATPSGGAATVSVWPYPQTPHGTPNVRLLKALAEFQLVGEASIREPSSRVRSVEFNARQIIRV